MLFVTQDGHQPFKCRYNVMSELEQLTVSDVCLICKTQSTFHTLQFFSLSSKMKILKIYCILIIYSLLKEILKNVCCIGIKLAIFAFSNFHCKSDLKTYIFYGQNHPKYKLGFQELNSRQKYFLNLLIEITRK